MNDVEQVMTRIVEPEPPREFAATVMARIARETGQEQMPARRATADTGGWWWLWTGAGTAVAAAVWLVRYWSAPGLLATRTGMGRVLWMPGVGPDAIVIALAVCLFAIGLFAPVRRRV